jgi:hypothetical protein
MKYYQIFNQKQDEVFPINLVLKYVGFSQFMYKAPNQIALNQTTRSQTKACIARLCAICALLR